MLPNDLMPIRHFAENHTPYKPWTFRHECIHGRLKGVVKIYRLGAKGNIYISPDQALPALEKAMTDDETKP